VPTLPPLPTLPTELTDRGNLLCVDPLDFVGACVGRRN
jgi:hypothetical protein